MKPKLTLIGILVMAIGIVISAALPAVIYIGAPLMFVGAFLFAGLYSEDVFIDYVTCENDNYIFSVRKKSYYHFLPFSLISSLFRTEIKFIYNVYYYKIVSPTLELENVNFENIDNFKIGKAEYKQLLENQKQQYLNKTVPQEIVADICSPENTKVRLAKSRYLIWFVLTLLSLTGLTVPSDWWLVIIFVSLFGSLAIFRYTEYKQVQFKKSIYDKYFSK